MILEHSDDIDSDTRSELLDLARRFNEESLCSLKLLPNSIVGPFRALSYGFRAE